MSALLEPRSPSREAASLAWAGVGVVVEGVSATGALAEHR